MMPDRCVVGGCGNESSREKVVSLNTLLWRRSSRSSEAPKEVDRLRASKEKEMDCDQDVYNLFWPFQNRRFRSAICYNSWSIGTKFPKISPWQHWYWSSREETQLSISLQQ